MKANRASESVALRVNAFINFDGAKRKVVVPRTEEREKERVNFKGKELLRKCPFDNYSILLL